MDFFRSSSTLIFIFYCLISILLTTVTNSFIITDDMYYNFFSSSFTPEIISGIIEQKNNWQWLAYVTIPISFLLKFFIISICLLAGLTLFRYEINFGQLFKIVLVCEGIFLIALAIKVTYFFAFNSEYTLQEYQNYYPLSLANYIQVDKLDKWMVYPLQIINLFELLYILVLSYGLCLVIKRPYTNSLLLTSLSYGAGLFIWLTFITFLSIASNS
jgi:hypothetical protein